MTDEPTKRKITTAELRIQKDFEEFDKLDNIEFVFPDKTNILDFNIIVTPTTGYWNGGRFDFHLKIPPEFPFQRPSVSAISRIWHPNIEETGAVCSSVFREAFTPAVTVEVMAIALLNLFYAPNPYDPLNQEAAQQMIDDEQAFALRAREYMTLYNTKVDDSDRELP